MFSPLITASNSSFCRVLHNSFSFTGLLSVYTYVIYDFCMNNWVLEMVDIPHCSMFTYTHTHTQTQLHLFIYLHQIRKQNQVLRNCHVVEFIEVISIGFNDFVVVLLYTNRISWSLVTEPIDKALTLLSASYTDVFPI